MKRYLLFCFEDFYPNGGWNDFAGSFDDLVSAQRVGNVFIRADSDHNAHIVEASTGRVMLYGWNNQDGTSFWNATPQHGSAGQGYTGITKLRHHPELAEFFKDQLFFKI